MACRSMATLNRLAPYGGEAPPPYEWTLSASVEDVVRDLEERLVEKEHELKQVFEGKQRLWEKEIEELKSLYAAKVLQVSQHAQHSERSLHMQLYKAQQEKTQMQEEVESLRREGNQQAGARAKQTSPTLEETQWEVCQKSGEISLLKQQLRDSQAEVTQKLSEIFHLKTQLREMRMELGTKDSQIDALKLVLQGRRYPSCPFQTTQEEGKGEENNSPGITGGSRGTTEERLRAELLLERRQNEAQAMAFEEERQTWQTEKDKVIRYQKELQANYLEMYHRNEALERELHQLRPQMEQGGGRTGNSRSGTPERVDEKQEDRPASGLPWIERIESSEI